QAQKAAQDAATTATAQGGHAAAQAARQALQMEAAQQQLVAAVIYAYKRWGWFRNVVQAAWRGIQTAALWAWNVVLKPTF
ncbi:hypothetical protein KBZ21_42430, partial [Streptomyces sp. A73]|nr:hypothetical protein [Streptomyces sp. A73]